MATKTISIAVDAYELLAREKQDRSESFSRVIRRLFAERPALTAGELLDDLETLRGKGAGPRRRRVRGRRWPCWRHGVVQLSRAIAWRTLSF